MDYAALFDCFAVIGGICHILCFLPQLYHMYRTKIGGALDTTYFLVCLTGSIFEFAYLLYIWALAAWVPLLIMVYLIIMIVLWYLSLCLTVHALSDYPHDDDNGG